MPLVDAEPSRNFANFPSNESLASRCSICGDPLADSIKVYDTPDGLLCSTCWNYQHANRHPLRKGA